jgi:hypothetical protein
MDRLEWRLDKAQNFLGQVLASLGIGYGSEDDLARNPFHLLNCLPKFSLVGNGLSHGRKLGLAERDGNGFLIDFSSPLVAASP